MTPHTWKTSEPVDCAQVGWETFDHCEVCGVMRVDGDKYTSQRFETQVKLPQYTIIDPLARAERVKLVDHWVEFSMDCAVAQEQLLYYILGRVQAFMAVDDTRYRAGSVLLGAIQAQPRTVSVQRIRKAYFMLEEHGRGPPR